MAADSVAANAHGVAENKEKLFETTDEVMRNKFVAYEHRAHVIWIRNMILQNYATAFKENRQLAMINLVRVWRNKEALLESTPAKGQVQENWRDSMLNEAKLDYLYISSVLNGRMANSTALIAEANEYMMAANSKIIEVNGEISDFNANQSLINTGLLDGSISPENATTESNAERVAANEATIAKVEAQAKANTATMEANLKLTMKNQNELSENAKLIYERYTAIEKDHDAIDETAHNIASMVGYSQKSSEAAASGSAVDAMAAGNAAHVKANLKLIFELETMVENNKFVAYENRAMVIGNRNLILENYDEAVMGNRQLANMNTVQVRQNRDAILRALPTDGEVQENWKNSMINKAHADFLEHRSILNGHVAEVNHLLAEANEKMIAANDKIMESNKELASNIEKHIDMNKKLFNGDLKATDATADDNDKRITSNSKYHAEIHKAAITNEKAMQEHLKVAMQHRQEIVKNAMKIEEHRKKIKENHAIHIENAKKVADLMR